MKNNYELKQTTILSIENEALREVIRDLKLKIKKLPKLPESGPWRKIPPASVLLTRF